MFNIAPPFYGSAYYPESWDKTIIDEDIRLMKESGLNTARIGEFAWKTMEPQEGIYDFSLFKKVAEKLKENGIAIVMGTPTCTPARMAYMLSS